MLVGLSQNTSVVTSSSHTTSPSGSVYYHHSPSDTHHHHNAIKYPENGHDTLSDFVTFVCQEAENSPQNSQVCKGASCS